MIHDVRQTARKIGRRLALVEGQVYCRQEPLPAFRYCELSGPEDPALAGDQIDDSQWALLRPDSYWSARLTDFVLRTRFTVPEDWPADIPAALYLPLSIRGEFCRPETLAYLDGTPCCGIDGNHQEILLPPAVRDGRPHLLALRGWTGRGRDAEPEPGKQPYLRPCALVQIDQPTRELIATARVALDMCGNLDEHDPARAYLLNALDDAFALLDLREPIGRGFYSSVPAAHAALRRGISRAGAPLDALVVATGHSHIDVAWLWSLAQVRRKAGRTFHTVMQLMKQYPEYHFTQSQPQLYEFIRQDYPELFESIKRRVRDGRWEAIGGMWVEADCNLSGPESLARQLLLGRSFFREHFGREAESPVLWLPDVFGYAWNLPQLIKAAGLEYFFTIKLSWNQYNRIPYDSFWWQGLDGTRVLTHFSPTPDFAGARSTTYNSMATPEQTVWSWKHYSQKELHAPLLMAYGHGDGGGGPTREMIENIRELSQFPGAPRVCQGSVVDFFRQLEAGEGERLPVWNGELYLELHRGTYTTQARNKRANRKSEFLLHDAEFLAAMAAQIAPAYVYPAAGLAEAWQLVCLNQFHDIIPGSSINEVYRDSQAQYAQVREAAAAVRDGALATIAAALAARAAEDGEERTAAVLLANPTSFVQGGPAFWPGRLAAGARLRREDGTPVASQAGVDGTWLAAGDLPPYSVTVLYTAGGPGAAGRDEAAGAHAAAGGDGALLENASLRVEFNPAGDITRIFDKTCGREVLPAHAVANQFQAFEDRPNDWDAWDLDIFYDDKMWLAEPATAIAVVEDGPLRATLEIHRRILGSEYVQRVALSYDSPRLDFVTSVDWHERHVLLKVAFPVDVLAPAATYDVQWGNVQRPTHRNTSWDWARFETCAQKWVDLSEGDYGVSLLNDCKYGHDIHDNVMRLSLLRSPTMPDPEADQGVNLFSYSLLPHSGGWDERTVSQAYSLNDPVLAYDMSEAAAAGEPAPQGSTGSLVSVDARNVVIETVKQAEDGAGLIVRLYEGRRCRGPVTLTAGFDLAGAWRANLLEETQEALALDGRQVRFAVKPYEIVTLRLAAAGT